MQPEYSRDYQDPPTPPSETPSAPPASPSDDPAAPGPRRVRVALQMPDTPPTYTYILLAIIVGIYLLSMVVPVPSGTVVKGYGVTTGEDLFLIYGAKVNEFILEDGEIYRLLTAMFLHGGLTHLFFNGYALYVIGSGIERLYGHARFLLIYFLGGLTGSVASLLFTPNMSVGASGALFAIFGAEMVFLYRHRRIFGSMAQRRLQSLLWLLALNLGIGLLGASLIDNWAHIGGLVAGLALAWLIGPQFALVPPTAPGQPATLNDTAPLRERLLIPFLWAAGLLLVVGVLMLG